MQKASCYVLSHKLVRYGDLIVITAGSPFGVSGTTNVMLVDNIGEVLVRGGPGKGKRVHGPVALLLSSDAHHIQDMHGKLVVIPHCDETFASHLKGAIGLILQNHPEDAHSEDQAKRISREHKIPLLIRADGACTLLKEGQVVTLDPIKGLVFKGVVESEEEMIHQVCDIS